MRQDIPAAQYLRMSTDHQQYSIENQCTAIQTYASQHGLVITCTYADAGKSGLALKGREGLRKLIQDVVADPPFRVILVYDVSRWGRFLDVDESAHYEFVCKSAGVPVHYCAEAFANDGSIPSTVVKSLKRLMAGEYVRELSAKVYEGSKLMAQRGFSTGGAAGYGFRRMLVSPTKELKHELHLGERKNIQQDRVIFVHGPTEEIECIRQIFRMFTTEGCKPGAIAADLNRRGIPYRGYKHCRWNFNIVDRILRNPRYAGCSVYGRTTQRLGIARTNIPPQFWVRTPGVWNPIVDMETFVRAERIFARQPRNKPDEQLLDELRALLATNGKLTGALLKLSCDSPPNNSYVGRFGSLSQAFALAGYEGKGFVATRTRRRLRTMKEGLLAEIVLLSGGEVSIKREHHALPAKLQVRDGELVYVCLCRCYALKNGDLRWSLMSSRNGANYTTLVAFLNAANDAFLHLYVVPKIPSHSHWRMRLCDPCLERGEKLDALASFTDVVQRVTMQISGELFSEQGL